MNIQEALMDMRQKVEFTEDKHTYKLISNDEWLQGTSTVASIVPKDWLSAWGAKEMAKYLGYTDYENYEIATEMLQKIKEFETPEQLVALLKFAKGACYRKSKEALADGKAGHKWLEEYVKWTINGAIPPRIPEGLLKRPLTMFVDWEKKNVKQWIASEALVVNPERHYAGTLDGIAIMNNGRFALTDFKFASRISEDSYLQTAGYKACFEPYLDVSDWDRIIIRLPKTLLIEEYDKKTYKYSMVDNNLEAKIVPTPYILDRDTFYSCLPLKKWINYVKNK